MQVADRSSIAVENHALMLGGRQTGAEACHLDIVLKPLSRPELGEIRIDDAVFAIGRTEQPFASYGNDIVNMLSRRHARIFRKMASSTWRTWRAATGRQSTKSASGARTATARR